MPAEKYQMVMPAPIVWESLITPKPAHTVAGIVYKAQYEVTFLFEPDHPDLKAIKVILGQLAMAQFGRVDNLKYPLKDGTKEADKAAAASKDREFFRGKVMFQPHVPVTRADGVTLLAPPRLVVLKDKKYLRFEDDAARPAAKKLFYPGCNCVGEFGFMAYTGMGGGVTAYVNEVLSLNSGERIAGGMDDEAKYGAADKWSQYVGTVSSVDPTAGVEISF